MFIAQKLEVRAAVKRNWKPMPDVSLIALA
jgi:hypothetical protein